MKQESRLLFPLILAIAGLLLTQCTKESEQDCTPKSISTNNSSSDPCIAQGIITILSPLGNGLEYKVDNLPFQTDVVFNNLLPGNHIITVKEANNCSYSFNTTISSVTPGSLFSSVKMVLAGNCVSCHGGSNPQAGLDFSRNCDIIYNWERINARAVNGNPSPMPQSGLMPLNERNKITNWINAGHRFSD